MGKGRTAQQDNVHVCQCSVPSSAPDLRHEPIDGSAGTWDLFYMETTGRLDTIYPIKMVTMTSTDPPYMTPAIKLLLKKKNRLMGGGRLEETSAYTSRVGQAIKRAIREDLSDIDPRSGMRDLWRRVGEVTKARASREPEGDLSVEDFNSHYAEISRDASYEPPHSRITVSTNRPITTELRIFHLGPSPPYS